MPGPFRWGILGTAGIADTFLEASKQLPDLLVAGVASRSFAKASKWAAERGIPQAFGSYDELLLPGRFDAIYCPLPNSLHAEWTIKALKKGIPVLCEKPLALDAVEAASIEAASVETGVQVAEAFMYRFHPAYQTLIGLLNKGTVGKIKTIFSRFTFMLDVPETIVENPALGGGALMDVGCYCVNASRMLAGMEPSRASAMAKYDRVDRVLYGSLEFPNGICAQFETGIDSFERRELEIAGTDGVVSLQNPWLPDAGQARLLVKNQSGESEVEAGGGNCYALEIADFMDAVRNHRAPRFPISDSVANMKAIDALASAAKTGRTVDF